MLSSGNKHGMGCYENVQRHVFPRFYEFPNRAFFFIAGNISGCRPFSGCLQYRFHINVFYSFSGLRTVMLGVWSWSTKHHGFQYVFEPFFTALAGPTMCGTIKCLNHHFRHVFSSSSSSDRFLIVFNFIGER